MKKILILLILIIILLPHPSLADVVPLGSHAVTYCNKFLNINDFPGYKFYFWDVFNTELQPIEQNKCLTFYKLSYPKIYAVANNNVDKISLNLINVAFSDRENIVNSNKYIIKSNYIIGGGETYVPDSNPLISVEDQHKIISVGNELVVAKYKQIRTYNGGKTEEEIYPIPEVKAEGLLANLLNISWYFYIPILGLLGLILVLLIRYLRKKI